MADEAKSNESRQGGSSTVLILGIVLICILAVFMVMSMNTMKKELIKLNQQVSILTSAAAQNSMAGFQAVDQDGNVVMRFAPLPMEDLTSQDLMSCPADN